MANYFVDSTSGSDSDNGTTTDLAWATLKHAVEAGVLVAGDYVFVHPSHSELPTADITTGYNGTAAAFIKIMGMPRPSRAIASSDWTNGSATVTIDDNDMTESAHEGRYITGPDGEEYLITRVASSSSIIIDREYAGTTATNSDSATIQADPDYAYFIAIDDSAWTIKVDDWVAAAHTRPLIDYNDGNYQFVVGSNNIALKNIVFMDSADSSGLFDCYATTVYVEGCLFKQSANNSRIVSINATTPFFKRTVVKGSAAGSNQHGFYNYAVTRFKDCASYNCGGNGLRVFTDANFEGLNLGVEQANGSNDIHFGSICRIIGRELRLGGTNGYVSMANGVGARVSIENNQKVLGAHYSYYNGGYFDSVTLTTETTPAKKLSDDVVRIYPNINYHVLGIPELAHRIFEKRIWTDTTSHGYRFYIYNNLGATINDTTALDNLFLKCTYISGYDDTTEYVLKTVYSTQIDIAQASSASDWDYLEVTGIEPAVAGWVVFEIYQCQYSESGTVYVEPVWEIV